MQTVPLLSHTLRLIFLGILVALLESVADAENCPSLTYSALPLGRDKDEVLATFRSAGCDVRERPKSYPDGLFLIDTESIQVKGLPSERPSARIVCACWAHITHADLIFGPNEGHPLYLVERRIDEAENNPTTVIDKFRGMLDPLLGDPGKPRFQDHRVEELGSEDRYRTHIMDWYDWRRDVRSYLIVKESRKKRADDVYVGHIWMPVIESPSPHSDRGGP